MNSQTPGRSLVAVGASQPDPIVHRTLLSEFVDIRALLALVWKNKWSIGASGFLSAVIAYFLLSQLPPYYTVEARILLDSRPRQVVNIDNVVQEIGLSGVPAITSEIAQMQSAAVLRPVAKRLGLADIEEFNPMLQEPSRLSAAIAAIRGLLAPSEDQEPVDAETAENAAIAVAAGIVAEQLSVTQLGESFVLRIQATASRPDLAALIANTVIEEYLQRQVDIKLAAAADATDTLERRVAELQRDVERSEIEIERRRAAITANGIASAIVLERQIAELSSRMVVARIENAAARARLENFNQLVADGAFAAAMQIASSVQLADLVERRDNLRQQNEALLRRSAGEGVEARQMNDTLNALEDSIRRAAAEVSMGLEAVAGISLQQIRQQEAQLAELEAAVSAQSSQLIDLRALEREAEAKRGIYETFLARLTETRELAAFQTPNASIVALAEPPADPTGPSKGPLTVLAALFAIGAVSGIVIWRDVSRSVLRTPAQIEAAVGAPLIGAFRGFHARRLRHADLRRLLADPPRDASVAANRIAAALEQATSRSGKLVLLVASAIPREGATALAVLLGRAFAAQGGRTVVVDCDMRGAGLLKSIIGATGEVETLEDMGFDVVRLPTGERPTLSRAELRDALARLRQRYDVVILDAPPILASADALPLSTEVDAVILAVKVESTPSGGVSEAAAELRRVGARLVGAVATDVDVAIAGFRTYAGATAVERAIRTYNNR